MAGYEQEYRRSLEDPESFWGEVAEDVRWSRRWDQVLDRSKAPLYRWFRGGELNTCFNAVDRHVEEGRAEQLALVWDSPLAGETRKLTYRELRDEVARFAGALRDQGVQRGDRVIIYMPMVPEAVVAMLACARLGAIHSVVFGGFASHELAARVDHAQPKLVVSASCGIEPSASRRRMLSAHARSPRRAYRRSGSSASAAHAACWSTVALLTPAPSSSLIAGLRARLNNCCAMVSNIQPMIATIRTNH